MNIDRRLFVTSTAALIAAYAAGAQQEQFRAVYVGVPRNGFYYWIKKDFQDLRKGDIWFFADEQDRLLVALTDPVPCSTDGNYSIVTEPVKQI